MSRGSRDACWYWPLLILWLVQRPIATKILKTIVLSDNSDQDDKDDDKDGAKDKTEKEALDVSFFHEHALAFAAHTGLSFDSFFISHEIDIASPYLESISQPPEHIG